MKRSKIEQAVNVWEEWFAWLEYLKDKNPNKEKKDMPGDKPQSKPLPKLMAEHYDSKGKIDPFRPLIQAKSETSGVVDNRPKRILTPLEKIDLSQIKLVAVIILKDRQIAMVEEASGKGYEVGIGTYIGKSQGRVSEIKSSGIVVKEIYKDFKGQLKERTKEIKLHKNEIED